MIQVKTVEKGKDDSWRPLRVEDLRGQRYTRYSHFNGDRCDYILAHCERRALLFRCTWNSPEDGRAWDAIVTTLRMLT